MKNKYANLLRPITIGNVVLKNRMWFSSGYPQCLQGPESWPNDATLSFYAGAAKNGAAVVNFRDCNVNSKGTGNPHPPKWDINDPKVQNYLFQQVEAIHFYNSKICISLQVSFPHGYNISATEEYLPPEKSHTDAIRKEFTVENMGSDSAAEVYHFDRIGAIPATKELSVEQINTTINNAVKRAMFYKWLGFDMCCIHMAYQISPLAYSLSPAINKRTDKYGGSVENRARLALELFSAIKKACGPDFLVCAYISGEDGVEGGYTIDDLCQYAKVWEGSLDAMLLRAPDMVLSHPTSFNMEHNKPMTLGYAEALKKSGTGITIVPVGGFQDIDKNEEYLAGGKADMIAMTRAFISDPEYGKKAYEGRGDDVVPCLRCNNCHGYSRQGEWHSVCSVNPLHGVTVSLNKTPAPVEREKRVAIVGGGAAGMQAAVYASARGHRVTLFEQSGCLGGQLLHANYADFKWAVKDYMDYLIHQMDKRGIDVRLNTKATPEMVEAENFDAVIVAVGAVPSVPAIPGADGEHVWDPVSVFGAESRLGKRVAIVGGGNIGTEAGMYLARTGHSVTVLTRQNQLAKDVSTLHYEDTYRDYYDALEGFAFITNATTTQINEKSLVYRLESGEEKTLEFDSVVVAGGMKPLHSEAVSFFGCAERLIMIGDCDRVGNIQKCVRAAYGAAQQL